MASRLKGVGESAGKHKKYKSIEVNRLLSDMSTALVALIRHVIDVDSPNIHIRNKATKVRKFFFFYFFLIEF